jgi:hypothetical protein
MPNNIYIIRVMASRQIFVYLTFSVRFFGLTPGGKSERNGEL